MFHLLFDLQTQQLHRAAEGKSSEMPSFCSTNLHVDLWEITQSHSHRFKNCVLSFRFTAAHFDFQYFVSCPLWGPDCVLRRFSLGLSLSLLLLSRFRRRLTGCWKAAGSFTALEAGKVDLQYGYIIGANINRVPEVVNVSTVSRSSSSAPWAHTDRSGWITSRRSAITFSLCPCVDGPHPLIVPLMPSLGQHTWGGIRVTQRTQEANLSLPIIIWFLSSFRSVTFDLYHQRTSDSHITMFQLYSRNKQVCSSLLRTTSL